MARTVEDLVLLYHIIAWKAEKLALLEAPIPGIGDMWEKIYTTPALWHFHFVHSPIALELVKGRACLFLEHFWQTLSPHPETFAEADRQLYAKSYAQEGAMRAAFEMFKTFDSRDATDNRTFAGNKLPMPVLTIEGDKSMGGALATPHTGVVSASYQVFAQNQSVCWRVPCLLHPLESSAYSCPQ